NILGAHVDIECRNPTSYPIVTDLEPVRGGITPTHGDCCGTWYIANLRSVRTRRTMDINCAPNRHVTTANTAGYCPRSPAVIAGSESAAENVRGWKCQRVHVNCNG